MKTKITIPKPCHEDWNKMTPTQKGAFCKVCSKEVKDFTKSTDQEILNTLNESESSICGHINASQLNRNLDSTPTLFQNWKIPFAASFGLLLSASTVSGQEMLGEMVSIQKQKKGEILQIQKTKVGKMKIQNYQPVDSKLVCIPPLPIVKKGMIETLKVDTPIMHQDLMVEGMIIKIELPDTLQKIDTTEPPKVIIKQALSDSVPFKEPIKQGNLLEKQSKSNWQVTTYPNPTQDWVSLEVTKSGLYNVSIFNSSGILILKKSFFGTALKVNLSNQTPGIYIAKVHTSGGIESKSIRIIKQ